MSTAAQIRFADVLTEEANRVRKNWGWFLALGIVQIVVGMLAVSFAFSATLASVVTLGILLLIAAGAQMAAAIWAWDWRGFFLFLLLAILYAVTGFLMLQQPLLAAEGLTLMLAAAFLVGGMFRIVIALVERFPSWGWVLCNGIITVLLGPPHLAAVARVRAVGAGCVRWHRLHRERRNLAGAGRWRPQRGGAVHRPLRLAGPPTRPVAHLQSMAVPATARQHNQRLEEYVDDRP
jgi:uncharacterized membrane protein HdeD (DUF308 family)